MLLSPGRHTVAYTVSVHGSHVQSPYQTQLVNQSGLSPNCGPHEQTVQSTIHVKQTLKIDHHYRQNGPPNLNQ
jgi:hypothetical protein